MALATGLPLSRFDQTAAGVQAYRGCMGNLIAHVSARRRYVRYGFGRNNYCDRLGCVAHPARLISAGNASLKINGPARPPLRISDSSGVLSVWSLNRQRPSGEYPLIADPRPRPVAVSPAQKLTSLAA